MQNNFERARQKNAQAYKTMFEIENTLREYVLMSVESKFGQKWLKQAIPQDVREKISRGIQYERSIPWQKAIQHNPLYYIDFPDIKKIIVNGTNWPSLFEDIFSSKSGTDSSLSDIEPVRNKIAHNRTVSDADIAVLQGVWTKIVGSIPPNELEHAQHRAGNNVSIASEIKEILNSINESISLIERGASLPQTATEGFTFTDRWWFDEVYLGGYLADIQEFSNQCFRYAEIPSGIGQAIERREWADQNSLVLIGTKARSDLITIISSAEP